MFGMEPAVLGFIALATVSAGGVAYAFLFNTIASEKQVGKRLDTIKRAESDRSIVKASRDRLAEAAKRRKSVQDSLKELDAKQKDRDLYLKKPPLKVQLRQAGISLPIERFYLFSAVFGVFLALMTFIFGAPLLVVPGALIVGSGLPLNDGIRLIANEAPEPVRSEFRRIVESQQLGLSTPEATLRMAETMPCPEAAFFGVVIQIQSQAGGNLSEALGNLSQVLRDRKKMKDKVAALSMEAKASAAIIGALPFIVAFLVYLSSPNYIMPLFTTSTGHLILGFSAVWMSMGIFVMRKMMNFEV